MVGFRDRNAVRNPVDYAHSKNQDYVRYIGTLLDKKDEIFNPLVSIKMKLPPILYATFVEDPTTSLGRLPQADIRYAQTIAEGRYYKRRIHAIDVFLGDVRENNYQFKKGTIDDAFKKIDTIYTNEQARFRNTADNKSEAGNKPAAPPIRNTADTKSEADNKPTAPQKVVRNEF